MKGKKIEQAEHLLKKAAQALEEPKEPSPPPEDAEREALEKGKFSLSATRRRALINYMAILFSVAFLLVALSLGIQYRDSQATISQLEAKGNSAIEKANQLQEDNRALQEQVSMLEEQLKEIRNALTESDMQEAIAQGANQELLVENLMARNRADAYQQLSRAQAALQSEKQAEFLAAMTELTELHTWLDIEDQMTYEALLDAMNTENQGNSPT